MPLLYDLGEFLWKLRQKTLRGPRTSLTERADRAAGDIVGYILERRVILCDPFSVKHSSCHLVHPQTPLSAWGALSATLMGVKLIQIV